MSSIDGAGLAGIQAATASLYTHAANVVAASLTGSGAAQATGGSAQATGDTVDLSREFVGMSEAGAQMQASVAVVHTGEQMRKTLLDMMA